MKEENQKKESIIEDFIIVYLTIVGKIPTMLPGIQEYIDKSKKIDCLLKFNYAKNLIDEKIDLKLSTLDCTTIEVTHKNYTKVELKSPAVAEEVLEKSIFAISETIIWLKGTDRVGKTTNYLRQIGRLDIKYCLFYAKDGLELFWINETTKMGDNMLGMISGLLPNMINKNGPTTIPIPYTSRRLLNVIDLINLGFYTEAFISCFALFDDLTQEVVKKGLEKKKFSKPDQKNFLRGIKEERLKHYLNNLMRLCDWESMDENNQELYKKVDKINSVRNGIVHNSKIIDRTECLEYVSTLINSINWLRSNPFGYKISNFPILEPLNFGFIKYDGKEKNTVNRDGPASDN